MVVITSTIENKDFGRKKTLLYSMVILTVISINMILFHNNEIVILVLMGVVVDFLVCAILLQVCMLQNFMN